MINVIEKWISIYGPPRRILTDNGREFQNDLFYEMCESMDIKVLTTAAESPWSNGKCEKMVGLLKEGLRKMKEEGCKDHRSALCWTITARNRILRENGYSPNQLVYGRDMRLKSIDDIENPVNMELSGQ